ncbi:MAG: hypothetical protein Q9184_005070 [Pyrenodesmia sp. 2 TL-2023]
MPLEDLKAYATSSTDFYALLDLTPQSSQKELDRQWRKTALKYHPDKVGSSDTIARERFHLAQIGYDLLSDPAAKAIYDGARSARERKKREREVFEGRRAQMRDELEARERGSGVGFKRERDEDGGEEERLERESRRLAEDGKRRRKEREEELRREMEEEKKAGNGGMASPPTGGSAEGGTAVSEMDRIVKVRWPIEREHDTVTEKDIKTTFSTFGAVEHVAMLGPKELRLGGKQQKRKKQLAAICMVQYASIVGAHAAVEDFPKQRGKEWERFDSVRWAANKEPDVINASSSAPSAPSSPARASSPHSSFLDGDSHPSTPTPMSSRANNVNGDGPTKKPSCSSFPSATFSTPKGSPFGKGLGAGSPNLEELTMIRLKNAEKKRLTEELQRQDEEAAKAKAKAKAEAESRH